MKVEMSSDGILIDTSVISERNDELDEALSTIPDTMFRNVDSWRRHWQARTIVLEAELSELKKDRDRIRDAAVYVLMGVEPELAGAEKSVIKNHRLKVLGNAVRDSFAAMKAESKVAK